LNFIDGKNAYKSFCFLIVDILHKKAMNSIEFFPLFEAEKNTFHVSVENFVQAQAFFNNHLVKFRERVFLLRK
jgi:hypothetical protein